MMKSHTSIPYVREAAALAASTAQQAAATGQQAASTAQQAASTAQQAAAFAAGAQQAQPTPAAPASPATPTSPAAPASPAASTAPATDLSGGIDIDPVDYWMRVMHFESRYWSINQLLEDLTATNILEISSGFSFRGLDLSQKKPVFYIDTDLPNIIAGKQRFIDALTADRSPAPAAPPGSPARTATPPPAPDTRPGHYELQPLNALDPAAFDAVINKFPPGPLTILNEGLLVYLDHAEKAQLCANIRKALLARTGKWITADIYIKRAEDDAGMRSAAWRKWSDEHGLEEKKFTSFEEAGRFFHSMGFEIEKEATQDYSRLTSFPQFLKAIGPSDHRRPSLLGAGPASELRRPGRPRLHATWRLRMRP